MSNPLPDSTVSALQTCETAALAAALIIASSLPEILDFTARVSSQRPSEWSLTEPPAPKETARWTGPVRAQRRRVEAEEREDA